MSRLIAIPALAAVALTALSLVPTDAEACAMALPPSMRVANIENVFDAIDAEADAEETVASAEALEKKNGFVRTPVEIPTPRIVTTTLGTAHQPAPSEQSTPEAKTVIPEVPQQAEQVASSEEPRT